MVTLIDVKNIKKIENPNILFRSVVKQDQRLINQVKQQRLL